GAEGSQGPHRVGQEHPEDHPGHGDGRRCSPAQGRAADPGAAPVRLGDPSHDAPGGRRGGQHPAHADPRRARVRAARRDPAVHGRPRPGRGVQLPDRPRRPTGRRRLPGRGQAGRLLRRGAPRRLVAALPQAGAGRRLPGLHRPPDLRGRPRDRGRPDGRLRRRRRGSGGGLLQLLRVAPRAERHTRDAAPAQPGLDHGGRRRGDRRGGACERAHRAHRVRAGSGRHPRAPRAVLRGDLDLPGAARIDLVGARRPHDGDAQRLRERGRAHQGPHAAGQPRAAGSHHPGNHGSRLRRRVAGL
ncbi:MAG: ATP synthase gamma chain, partial [uncultured Solirubrobacteraceae bacterium]